MQQVLISPTGNRKHISAEMESGNSYQPEPLHFRILLSKKKKKSQNKFSYVDIRKDYVRTFSTQLFKFHSAGKKQTKTTKTSVCFHAECEHFTNISAQLPHLTQHDVCINLLKMPPPTHYFLEALGLAPPLRIGGSDTI